MEEETRNGQRHEDIVPDRTWWWGVYLCLSGVSLVANLLFLITVLYNRKRRDLKTFVTAVIIAISVLDIIDVIRILPILSEDLFYQSIFRHIFCSFGIFHELSIAIFLVLLSVVVCIQAGREVKYYTSGGRASLPQKVLIPLVLLGSAGAAAPFFLIPYDNLGYTCTDPFRIEYVIDPNSSTFAFDIYSTVITIFTYVLPVLVIPITIPVASIRMCVSRQCCVLRFKQPMGELVMVTVMLLSYVATVVGVMLPRIDQILQWNKVEMGPAPLLWELANASIRPLCYFMMNPGVWEGLRILCCRKRSRYDDEEEIEVPLSPVTTV